MKEFADDNFKFVENGRKLSRQVENRVEKGEIARYDFSFSHSVFKGLALQTRENQDLFGKGLKKVVIQAKNRTPDLLIPRRTLYLVATKACAIPKSLYVSFYTKTV